MKRIISAMTALLLTASLLVSCGSDNNSSSKVTSQPDSSVTDSSISDTADSSAPDSSVPDNDEITPNAESDFVWHVLTADETTNSKCVGGVVITSYAGESDEVVIPKTIDDKPVVAIGEFAFSPYTIDEVLKYKESSSSDNIKKEFSNLHYLESLFNDDIPLDEAISELEQFKDVSSLKSVMFPSSVTIIGNGAFAFCVNLESVLIYGLDEGKVPVLTDEIIKDDSNVGQFCACLSLKENNFYINQVGSMQYGSQCYDYCISLEKVYLYPTEEGKLNFSWCIPHSYKISEVIIADGTTRIYKYDDEIAYPFKDCTFYVPESVTGEGRHSFCQHNYYENGGSDVSEGTKCSYDGITIITPAGSYAEQFAKDNGIKYENE